MLLFRLAEKLGYPDPSALGDMIPAALLKEWGGYWRVRNKWEREAVENASKK